MSAWHCERAWVGDRCAADVRIDVDGDRITAVTAGGPREGAERVRGLTLPGLANAHSHVFHRALRGCTHDAHGDFWSWRAAMYGVAARLDPDALFAIARATYAEMALAGITAVGEFHYVHHQPGGRPYEDTNAMTAALTAGAEAAGVRLTVLDACYLRGGFDQPLDDPQRRFGDGDVDAWAARVAAAPATATARVGAAIHSVRAVDAASMATVASSARQRRWPLHLHLSEQPAENEACLAATGRTPAALARDAGVLTPATTAVHATHVSPADVATLGAAGLTVCLCPTTERDLADGVGPAGALRDAGARLCVGTDSNAVIDVFEEARAVELDERLVSGARGRHDPVDLLAAATRGGYASIGWDGGELRPGALADFVALDLATPRLAGFEPEHAAAHAVFAASAADVHTVVVGGRAIVRDGSHAAVGDVGAALQDAIATLRA